MLAYLLTSGALLAMLFCFLVGGVVIGFILGYSEANRDWWNAYVKWLPQGPPQ